MFNQPTSTFALLRLAIPSALFTILTNGYRIVDQFYAQTISVDAQAAIGSSVFVLLLFYAAFELTADGAGPLIARATGANDTALRQKILGSAIFGTLWLTGGLMLIGLLGTTLIVEALGLHGAAAVECTAYLRALFWTMLPLVLTPLMDQAFISLGNARPPMILHGLSLMLNLILTPVLMHTADLGIAGAAYAANISRGVATAIGLQILMQTTGLSWSDIRHHNQLQRIINIGFPVAMGTAFFSVVYWMLLRTSISPLGPHINAALGIGFSALETFTWPIFHGLALAVGSLVGRYLGANRPDLARALVHTAIPLATLIGVLASMLFYFGSVTLTGLFTNDQAVHRAATEYAVILAASQFVLAWESLSEGVLAGAGDTRIILLCSAPFNLVRVPLAWFLAFPMGLGAPGIWWAINLTTYAKAFCKSRAVWQGRWLTIKI